MVERVAIYPGTFDPITIGHVDLIRRGAQLFDRVVVAVAESKRKNPCFDLKQRVVMCQKSLSDFDNVSVEVLRGLTVDFVEGYEAKYLLRGLRAVSDFDYELQIAEMNHHMNSTLETVFLPASPQYAFVSGSMVREIMLCGAIDRLELFVPACVVEVAKKMA